MDKIKKTGEPVGGTLFYWIILRPSSNSWNFLLTVAVFQL